MKTKTSILTIFAVALVFIATASDKPRTHVRSLNADQVLVTVQSEEASKMEVSIEDNNGNIVYYKRSKKPIDSYAKIFNVQQLEDGDYSLALTVNDRVIKRNLAIYNEKISVGEEQDLIPPFFTFDGEKLILAHLNFENENYVVEITGREGSIYKASVGNDTSVNAKYDLSRIRNGNYELILSSANNDYKYCFSKTSKR